MKSEFQISVELDSAGTRFCNPQGTGKSEANGQSQRPAECNSAIQQMADQPWADLSARFAGREQFSGAAILVAPDHLGFPPEWLTRHYGVLCLGWPGVKPRTFQPGEIIRCRYRIWIHRGAANVEKVNQAYRAYEQAQLIKRPGI